MPVGRDGPAYRGHMDLATGPVAVTGPIAVTGATGGLGGRVARRLAGHEVPQRLVVRDPARAPRLPGADIAVADFADPPSLHAALTGIHTLLLVSATES